VKLAFTLPDDGNVAQMASMSRRKAVSQAAFPWCAP
jgi:hypothetical protein